MKIGDFEDRIKVETRRRFSDFWVSLLEDYNQRSDPEIEKRIVNGIQRGLIDCLQEVIEWLNTPDTQSCIHIQTPTKRTKEGI